MERDLIEGYKPTMHKLYFDTSVWLAYLRGDNEFYHREAILWFDLARKGRSLVVSKIVDYEIKLVFPGLLFEYKKLKNSLVGDGICSEIKITHKDKMSPMDFMGSEIFDSNLKNEEADIFHICLIGNNSLCGVSADFTHWPSIANVLGAKCAKITDIYDEDMLRSLNVIH